MSTHRSSSLIIDGGISLSFREELATTIHGAFEIAVEIVVLEITKLVDQALGDVHEQMSETLRENKSLKLLLKAAEQKLESLSGSVKCESSGQLTTVESSSESCRHQHSREDSDGSKSDQETKQNKENSSSLNKADEGLEENFIHEAETCSERLNESFDEIREDGRVCSYDINATHEDPKQDSSSSFSDSQMNPGSVDSEPDAEGDDDETPVQPKAEHFHVKEERSDLELGQGAGAEAGPSPGCSFDSAADDEFGSDSLALAQSKMLEDWRPDPQPKENETDPQQPGPSHTLETSDLSSSIGGLPVFPAPFPGLCQSGDRTALSHPSPQHYNVHIRTNFTPNMHVCKICGQSFHRQSDLKRHHSQQHRSGPANQNPFSGSIRTPKRQMFPPGQSPYHCTECGRDFNRMENLKTHLRIHTGERPYSCSVCGVRFRHSGALTRHFRIHTGEKPYVCGECGKTFRNCGGLRLHQRSHNRERGEMF